MQKGNQPRNQSDQVGKVARITASALATHNVIRMLRRATGLAQRVPGSQARCSSRRNIQKPDASSPAVARRKYGLSGSNRAAMPAPETPNDTATRGPAQQSADARAAVIPPPA